MHTHSSNCGPSSTAITRARTLSLVSIMHAAHFSPTRFVLLVVDCGLEPAVVDGLIDKGLNTAGVFCHVIPTKLALETLICAALTGPDAIAAIGGDEISYD